MTIQSPEEIFKSQVHAGLVERNIDAFVAHFAPDCILRDMSEPKPRIGHAALREWVTSFYEAMADTEVEYLSLFSDAEYVLSEFVIRGLYRGDGADPGGTRVELQYCVIDEFKDGLTQRETVYGVSHEQQLQAATRSLHAK